MASTDFAIAFLAGLIPILFWLWFWLHEDRPRPEPIILIIITFLAGMMVVPIALPLQKMAIDLYTGNNVMFVWVIIEEVLKRSEEHTSELQSQSNLVCRLLLEKKKTNPLGAVHGPGAVRPLRVASVLALS